MANSAAQKGIKHMKKKLFVAACLIAPAIGGAIGGSLAQKWIDRKRLIKLQDDCDAQFDKAISDPEKRAQTKALVRNTLAAGIRRILYGNNAK